MYIIFILVHISIFPFLLHSFPFFATFFRNVMHDNYIFLLEIHFAIIIDNHEEIQEVNKESRQVNDLRKTLKCIGFYVLSFNYLSSQSISCLLEAFRQVDHSQLASFALVFLSKGHTNHLYGAGNDVIIFEEVFNFFNHLSEVPKLFLFHLAYSGPPLNDRLTFPNPPKKSIALVVSLKLTANRKISPAISFIISNLNHEECCFKPLKQCFKQMKNLIDQLDSVSCDYKCNLEDNFVLPTFCGENDIQ